MSYFVAVLTYYYAIYYLVSMLSDIKLALRCMREQLVVFPTVYIKLAKESYRDKKLLRLLRPSIQGITREYVTRVQK